MFRTYSTSVSESEIPKECGEDCARGRGRKKRYAKEKAQINTEYHANITVQVMLQPSRLSRFTMPIVFMSSSVTRSSEMTIVFFRDALEKG